MKLNQHISAAATFFCESIQVCTVCTEVLWFEMRPTSRVSSDTLPVGALHPAVPAVTLLLKGVSPVWLEHSNVGETLTRSFPNNSSSPTLPTLND